jgi:hypothetical protein
MVNSRNNFKQGSESYHQYRAKMHEEKRIKKKVGEVINEGN